MPLPLRWRRRSCPLEHRYDVSAWEKKKWPCVELVHMNMFFLPALCHNLLSDYVCVRVRVCVSVRVCLRPRVSMHALRLYLLWRACVLACMRVCACVIVFMCVCVWLCSCVCVPFCLSVCMYVCMYDCMPAFVCLCVLSSSNVITLHIT